MAELTSRSAEYTSIDAQRAKLPAGVKSISLIGVSIGKGVTAVVAGFSLDESVSARLNEQLRAPHQHEVIRRKGQMAVSQPPKAVLHYRTQRARSEVHRELRRWMSRTLPGAFASARHPQPLFDVIFFNVADPAVDDGQPSVKSRGVVSLRLFPVVGGGSGGEVALGAGLLGVIVQG
ncbi:hypothetical protein PFZ49_10105, partial [Microbacterium lacticum]|uniref:hypothetical protein n=1 Tax=Microbacterium lacticum TaxID=33885 RepID=UPI003A8B2332